MRQWIVALALLCLVSAVSSACNNTHPVLCLGTTWDQTELCVETVNDCPARPTCPETTPFRCVDDSCEATPAACQSKTADNLYVCGSTGTGKVCWDGRCSNDQSTLSKEDCEPMPACPPWTYRCGDLSCSSTPCSPAASTELLGQCDYGSNITKLPYVARLAPYCCGYTPAQISQGARSLIATLNVPYAGACSSYYGCAPSQFMCADYTCEADAASCSGFCPDDAPYRCYGKRFGKCVASLAECATPPIATRVLPVFAPIGIDNVTVDILSEDKTLVGSVSFPQFLNPVYAPVHIQIDNSFSWEYFQINRTFNAPITYQNLINGPDWSNSDRIPLSVYSPLVRIFSPDLELSESIPQVYNLLKKFLVKIQFENVTIPEDVMTKKVCLGFIKTETKTSGSRTTTTLKWECADSTPKIVDNTTWYGYAPLNVFVENPYFALILDDRLNDDDDEETVQGGFFALGIVLVVVLGIIFLGNRETLIARVFGGGQM